MKQISKRHTCAELAKPRAGDYFDGAFGEPRLNQRSRGKSRTIQTPFSLICGLFRPAKGAETFYIWEIGVEIMADEPRMPLTHAGCAEKAEDCRQDARHELNSQHRALLEHMATNWDRIALSIRSNTETTK